MMKYPQLFDPKGPSCRDEVLSKMRTENPVYYLDTEFFKSWMITSYDDVAALLHDKRLTNSNTLLHLQSAPLQEQHELEGLKHYFQYALPETTDARHKVLQKFFLNYFSPKTIASIREQIEEVVDSVFDQFDKSSTINFVEMVAYPLPAIVVANILGVPRKDYSKIVRWSEELVHVFKPYDFEVYKRGQSALLEMNEYNRQLMVSESVRPDSLLFALSKAIDQGEILEEEALVNCANILFAGHETTADALSKGLLEFFNHQAQLQEICANNALLSNAVEEVLRKVGVVGWVMRVAKESFNYGGQKIKKGDRLMLSLMSANLDEKYFVDSGMFDIKRPNAKLHLGFGKGKHYCLGAALARAELEVAFSHIFSRFPRFEIDTQNIVYGPAFFLNHHLSGNLPVIFDAD